MPLSRSVPVLVARLERAVAANAFESIATAINAIELGLVDPSRELQQAVRVACFMCNRAAELADDDQDGAFHSGAIRSVRRLRTLALLESAVQAARSLPSFGARPRHALVWAPYDRASRSLP